MIFKILLLSVFLYGCQPYIDHRGYNPEDLDLTKICVGQDTSESVREKLGTPSVISPFSQSGQVWYYVSKKTSTTSFYTPKTLDQRTLLVRFDNAGRVIDKKEISGEIPVEPKERETDVRGHDTSLLKDIFGNFGRYSTKSQAKK